MNQILFLKKNYSNYKKKQKKTYIFFVIIFILCFFSLIILIYKLINNFQISNINYKFSESLQDILRMQSIYDNTNIRVNTTYPIIGKIEIEKLKLNYPIFSYTNDELLKIGICKVYGPNINSNGNLCLAGHNYNNNKLFSDLKNLYLNDSILIYDNSNNYVEYIIYKKFEVPQNDTSILKQTTNFKEITLITCNNINKKRLIIKAKEID